MTGRSGQSDSDGPTDPTGGGAGRSDGSGRHEDAGAYAAYSVIGYLLAGLLFWGGVGFALDRWLGTNFLVLIGMLVGGAAAMYLIYVRYGKA
ncbi:MAG: synthase protein [Mycobacteriales bacterium]|jgi:F0F1-type ATP synthase assembly protein I